jgi:enoyl-CoA hydratase/3-hydroxyacyl-CoA dehydrogenase
MHFFNPVLLMDLVEVIPSARTRPEALATVQDVARRLGKTVVTLRKDTPGFVTSRLITTWVGAAALCADHQIASRESIDAALRHKAGFPMGPFELADYTGLDIGLHAADYLANRLGPSYQASLTLRALVEKGDLGKKRGRGFYEWKDGRLATPIPPGLAEGFDPTLVMAVVVNEAAKLLEQGVASARDIDLAMRQGCAFPQGPFEWADAVGVDVVLKALYTLEERTGAGIATPYELLVEMVEEGRLGRKTGRGFIEGTSATTAPAQAAASTQAASAVAPAAAASIGAPSGYETVLVSVDREAHVGTITLNRPHRLHALNAALFRDLRAALRQMDEDDAVRVVLLTGSGDKAFCAGADLGDASGATPAQMTRLARAGHLLCIDMEKMRKPVVAAINGHALGGGFELALPADFRVAARRATFALPEVTLGLLPAMGGTQRLPRLVGLARAKEIAMLGNRFDAQQALAWGVVHRVFENETFEQESKAFAADLATRAPLSLQLTKQLLNAAPTSDILAGMEAEATAFGVLASTEDMLEGVGSMFARKKPSFTGK